MQASEFKSIVVGAVCKHPNTNPDYHIWKKMLQTYSNCGKNMNMLGDLNENLLKANRLEQTLNKLNLFQLIREPTRVTSKSKTLTDVIITNNRDTVLPAETSLSIADHRSQLSPQSAVQLISESKEWNHLIYGKIKPIIHLNFLKLYLCNYLIIWTWCMKLIV